MQKQEGIEGGYSSKWRIRREDALFWALGLALLLLSWVLWFFLERGSRWEALESWIVSVSGGKQARGFIWYSATILSDLGHGFFLGSLLWALWVRGMKRARFQEGVLWFALSGLVCTLLKYLVSRERPFEGGAHSWPSGHSAAVFSVALFLRSVLRKPWGNSVLFLAVLVGASRVFHLRHYPSDVFGGFALAFLLGPIVRRVPLFFPGSLGNLRIRQASFGFGLFVFLLGVQVLPSRQDLSIGFLGLLLFLGLMGIQQEGRA
jgi:membrane-associated phospholipid phosphatase